MNVTLVSSPYMYLYKEFSSLAKVANHHPPLGLCYLASALQNEGHSVRILDAEAEGLNLAQLVTAILDEPVDLVGLTTTTPLIGSAAKIAAQLKNQSPELPVIVGGPHITLTGQDALRHYSQFDFGYCGEGEEYFPEFVTRIAQKNSPESTPGVISRTADGSPQMLKPNDSAQPLDEIAFPDRSKINIQQYLWSVPGKGVQITASIQASRGCPLKCIFCSEDRLYNRKIRFRSPDNILSELEKIANETPARHIVFLDDTITLHRRWALQLFQGMIDKKLSFSFECETTGNRIDRELVSLMVEAGLVRVNFGIENGSPEMLARLGKGVTLEEIRQGYKLLKEFGIETRGSVILGNPYETKKTVWNTLRFIWSLKELDQAYINIATPYPGTILREMAIRGEGGLRLIDSSYEGLKRYGSSVMEVNDLSQAYLARMQKFGTLVFYLHPRRFAYNLQRAGIKAAWRNGWAFLATFKKNGPVQAISGI